MTLFMTKRSGCQVKRQVLKFYPALPSLVQTVLRLPNKSQAVSGNQ